MFDIPTLGEDGDRGVSPVIGVILMVAITVILAAVIASFVLGLGDQTNETAPNINFNGEFTNESGEDDQFILSVDTTDGDAVVGDFEISNDTESAGLADLAENGISEDDSIGAGDQFEINASTLGEPNGGVELDLVFRGDNEQVYDTFEVPDKFNSG